MNIFAVDSNPSFCARYLDNRRLNKMIVESCQLLATYCRFKELYDEKLYKPTHQFHPCQKWLKEDFNNVRWLITLTLCYLEEYRLRKLKIHACSEQFNLIYRLLDRPYFSDGRTNQPKNFCNCTEYKDNENIDVHTAYRLTLAKKWQKDLSNGLKVKFS